MASNNKIYIYDIHYSLCTFFLEANPMVTFCFILNVFIDVDLGVCS